MRVADSSKTRGFRGDEGQVVKETVQSVNMSRISTALNFCDCSTPFIAVLELRKNHPQTGDDPFISQSTGKFPLLWLAAKPTDLVY
jgi:hypothetical protein